MNLKKVLGFLGTGTFQSQIHLIQDGTYEEDLSSCSRRELFSNFSRSLTRATLELLPELPGEKSNEGEGLFYRYLLADTIYQRYLAANSLPENTSAQASSAQATSAQATSAKSAAYRTYIVSLPHFTDQCYGCGSCVTVCPGSALQISSEKDGIRTIYITPWRCTACGLCAEICRNSGVDAPVLYKLKHLHIQPLANIRTRSCSRCGAVISPQSRDGLCVACRQREKKAFH